MALSLAKSTAVEPRPAPPARVGPNAIIQLGEALQDRLGAPQARAIFAAAGLQDMLTRPPVQMVDESIVAALFRALFARLPPADASDIATEAGRRTADYLLANRIPRLAQFALTTMPAPLAAPLLLGAIAKNAWTFAGSGTFRVHSGSPNVIEIAANPLAMPGCPWHLAVFQRLFRALVVPRAEVRHPRCCQAGASSCRYEIAIDPPARDNPLVR